MITFAVDLVGLLLEYSSDRGRDWIESALESGGRVTISKVFNFQTEDLVRSPDPVDHDGIEPSTYRYEFRFARREVGYYRIKSRVFGISGDVLLADSGIAVEARLFVATRNISIFRRLSEVVGPDRELVIGGSRADRIPAEVFEELLKKFPNSVELDRYANARVANIIGEYFDGMRDYRAQYERYLSRSKSVLSGRTFSTKELLDAETNKFIMIRDTISQWLKSSDGRTEKEWQRMILEFILLIFPKYVAVLENVQVDDYYSKSDITQRYIDIALVDANGNLDVIEIKRPFDDILLSKTPYRDNFVPTKELSGAIMQAEKYLFHLSKWGVAGERKLNLKYGNQLPEGMSIRITNPKALIILGRDRTPDGDTGLNHHQLFDLEVIKRKYANMMDLVTYDDLLSRLDNIIGSLRKRPLAEA
jgi:Domain of unknown function (DUF4263)